jgi:hypothetical protein
VNCLPIDINWRPVAGVSGKCINIDQLFFSTTISDIVSDGMKYISSPPPIESSTDVFVAVILAMPWPQIWRLQMTTTRKFQVGGIFLLGGFVVGAGIARCVLSASGVTSPTTDLDYTCKRSPQHV